MPDPTVIQVARRFKRDLATKEATLMAEMLQTWIRIASGLEAEIIRLAELGLTKDARHASQVRKLARFQYLHRQIHGQIEDYAQRLAHTLDREQLDVALASLRNMEELITLVSDEGTLMSFARLQPGAVEAMMAQAQVDHPMFDVLMKYTPSGTSQTVTEAVNGLAFHMAEGIAQGLHPTQVANAAINKGLAKGLYNMQRVARTEMMRAMRDVGRETMAASGVVEGYCRIATRDTRVCAGCLMDDGHFFRLDEVMPEHPQGRCGQVPKVIGAELPPWQKGPEWFRGLNAQKQKDIIGPKTWDAWKAGKFKLSDLVKVTPNRTWGPSVGQKSLKELS